MPGMNSGLNINDPTVVAAFKQALLHQGFLAVMLFATIGLLWVTARELRSGGRISWRGATGTAVQAEPRARMLMRVGFGLLWLVDGILQAQPGMAVGLPSQVIQPTAASSPPWVQHLVNWAGTSWSYHPIQVAAAAVWIQVGIGIWLLAAKGPTSRLAGVVSAGWGLVVWVFGESLGGVFAPGLSWLTGAPGAALCYCAAGALIALPASRWQAARTGRLMLRVLGVFLTGMAVLQAWPGRGFWQGEVRGQPGSLTAMTQSMAGLSQPSAIANLVSWFSSVIRAHGFVVNLIAVAALAAIGLAFAAGWPRLVRPALFALLGLCAVVWLFVQDLGFFGGLGTDPNSMIPMALLAVAGYLALTPAPAPAPVTSAAGAGQETPPADDAGQPASWRQRLAWPALSGRLAEAKLTTVACVGAMGVVLLGALPLAAAQASGSASAILAQAVDGASAPLQARAPAFTLTDQHSRPVSLASLRGKTVLLTFLDPVCVTDCPLIAQEFRAARSMLGASASHVELVAVNLNPDYRTVAYLQAFDRQEDLAGLPDWLYLTGTATQLAAVWRSYGVVSQTLPAGAMLGHSDSAFVIGPDGRLRQELDLDPGPGTAATKSSFAAELAQAARQAMGS
jgi:cytochrome oxidase Cu insertion factor (SCO1/SenC/PrrC family)